MLRYALFVIRRIRILRFSTLFNRHSQQRTASTSIQDQPTNSSNGTIATQTTIPKYLFHFMVRPIVISGPSGGGKSTILTKAMKEHPEAFAFSVSHTTRKPRANEIDGEHYHFVDYDEMKRMIKASEFIEHAQFGGNIYGTSKKSCDQISKSGKICVLDVELQGVKNLKNNLNFDANYILILPPSLEKLEQRLRQRGTETEESINKRLEHARKDMEAVKMDPKLFDHVVINDDLDTAYQDFLSAIKENLSEQTKQCANNSHVENCKVADKITS